jgi:hypothetical protein
MASQNHTSEYGFRVSGADTGLHMLARSNLTGQAQFLPWASRLLPIQRDLVKVVDASGDSTQNNTNRQLTLQRCWRAGQFRSLAL